MKVLVTGASGTLGVQVAKAAVEKYGRQNVKSLTHAQLDITQEAQVRNAYELYRPDVVFNCAGIIRPRPVPESVYRDVNVKGPLCLASQGIKVIQVSTDCVFNGVSGPYYEDTPPNAEDVYGKTKAQGELKAPHLTVRLSFVGLGKRGLLHWLLNQKGSVNGYRKVLWNGMTAPVAGRRIVESVDKTGTLHLHGDDMTKHDLLSMANEVFGLGLTVNPVDEPVSDMRLRSHYSNGHVPDFREQLEELRRYR